MAQKDQLLSDSYQLSVFIFNCTKNMAKALRPTLGRSLEENSIQLIFTARKALSTKDHMRISSLHQASEHLDKLKLLLQLSYDMQATTIASIAEMSTLTNQIGKQIGGLIRFYHQQNGRNLPSKLSGE